MQAKYPCISQDGRPVIVLTDRSELYVIDIMGESLCKIADNSALPAALSPDGNVLVRNDETPNKGGREELLGIADD